MDLSFSLVILGGIKSPCRFPLQIDFVWVRCIGMDFVQVWFIDLEYSLLVKPQGWVCTSFDCLLFFGFVRIIFYSALTWTLCLTHPVFSSFKSGCDWTWRAKCRRQKSKQEREVAIWLVWVEEGGQIDDVHEHEKCLEGSTTHNLGNCFWKTLVYWTPLQTIFNLLRGWTSYSSSQNSGNMDSACWNLKRIPLSEECFVSTCTTSNVGPTTSYTS